ncbi:TonB-dependent receptor plug domain-containing protein [Novosphingobium sp. ST904]|uniref:TonB-dependent receptor plug domain-containing protein n=1 Tax=Novosphingobium sp. ST904 TaxID=1684385 RepID=UPI0006C85B36|nr:TonB-dependent receptor plug domain-containing protein [Novosphingobium sp. ST904]KPH63321.1 TonB-dependent receptor [Novosphingobium sp. ST904]TCM40858.1 TonB-dependent receptor-like protein [Novosphingobium sp. ST904]
MIQSRIERAGFAALMVSTAAAALLAGAPAQAQDLAPTADDGVPAADIVVTGSRIRRDAADETAPLNIVDSQTISDRGYISASDALNQLTSNSPMLSQADGSGEGSGSGQQFPNLFGLGAGRTLTLLNGRRMVTSSSGLGDAQVDANIIPLGLLDRVEVVQGGGAAVYGSDAIAGVVNYVLKDKFEGLELDAQNGISSRGDYHTYSLRGTAGKNFADGRGNIAIDVNYARTPTLMFADRPLSALGRLTVSNPADQSATDGIPAVKELLDAHFWEFNSNGVLFNAPAPFTRFLTQSNGTPLQFDSSGNVVSYDPGTDVGIPFSSGGQGFSYRDLAGLRTGVERFTGNLIAHYDLTDAITLRTELLYAHTAGTEIPQGQSRTILNYGTYAGPVIFTINNPYLTDQAKSVLSSANPGFAAGAPLFLSKYFYDLTPDNLQSYKTDTYRGLLAVDGEFSAGSRNFYWTVSGSYARVDGSQRRWEVDNAKYSNAINAVLSGGQIVCGINADADPVNNDASCAPINPFGNGNVSSAAQQYVSVRAGLDYRNEQTDFLATLGGDIIQLPGGTAKFSLAYEHRDEQVSYTPLAANQQGLFGGGTMEVAQSAGYNTDELSAELLIPMIDSAMNVPIVRMLEASAAGRLVDNSIAGKEQVWDLGLRWQPLDGITLRVSRSRNFRAPTLAMKFSPTTTSLGSVGYDPCDADRINSGSNPSVRYANCLAAFTANPNYGVEADGTNAGKSAAERLAAFQDPAENFERATITSGGNANLRNEISDTFTYGVVLQPRFIPGLTISADRIEIDLKDGLSAFTTEDFTAACYDNTNPDPAVCNAFTRIASSDGVSPGGTILAGTTTTFNAGVVKYRGEVYAVDYTFEPGNIGAFHLGVNATHNTLLTTSVTGENYVRTDNTYEKPTWEGRFNLDWTKGPVRLSYQAYYLDKTKAAYDATIETTPNPLLDSNLTHSISMQFDTGRMILRAGIDNFTDEAPSYPQIAYGDILGRRFWVGAKLKM